MQIGKLYSLPGSSPCGSSPCWCRIYELDTEKHILVKKSRRLSANYNLEEYLRTNAESTNWRRVIESFVSSPRLDRAFEGLQKLSTKCSQFPSTYIVVAQVVSFPRSQLPTKSVAHELPYMGHFPMNCPTFS